MITDILTALLVVAVVGFIASVILVLASHFFAVKTDERVTKIRECLPGANCGACGYAGCDAYAKALVEEQGVKTTLCVPGAQAVVEQISEILGVAVAESEVKEKSVAVVHCNGTCDAAPKKAIYDGMNSCRAASVLYGGANACNYGCVGCGDCADVCPADAICVVDGVARVDSRLCIGCGKCAKTCPKHIISLVPIGSKQVVLCNNKEKGAVARKNCKNACIACKKCELNCHAQAISVKDNLAAIDYEKCTNCGKCVEVCPVHCITAVNFEV
ncbi:MAG: RnfABCDGE type electron transport complex subunit B [Clostridia bacterium]|nr:RnfABCDGE type electron transport complex subunit B [Clostridia bacterium]